MAFRKINDGVPVPSGITGSASSIITDTLTANRAAFFDAAGRVQSSIVPSVKLEYLDTFTITSPVNGQTLQYNGTAWVNAPAASGGETISSFLLMGA